LIDIIDIKSFEIDDLPFHLSPTEKKLENFHPVETKKELFQINRIIQMLDLLNVKDDIRISELSVEDYRNLDRLTCAFIDKCPVNGLNPDLHPISVLQIQISNIKLALSFIRNKNNSDEYCIYDYFKTRFDVFSQDANGEEYPTSQYQILRSKDFVELSNIDFDVLLPSYQSIEENVVSISHANNTLLELLLAFDRNPKRKSDIINVAKEFAEWLLHVDDNNLPPEFKILNMLQVTKREREFTIEEIKSLCAITENSSMREDILTGAYLLLGNHVAAKIHFEKIEPKLREDFREYPIFHFWKQSDGGMDNE
jgi:hypothetical protein